MNATREAWIHALPLGKPFDMTDPCGVCGKTGHAFEDYKPLKNIPFLQRHLTNSQTNALQNQKMIGEAMANQSNERINQLMNATAAMDTEEEEQEMAFDDDATEVTNNTDQDCCQGGIQNCGVRTQPTQTTTPRKPHASTACRCCRHCPTHRHQGTTPLNSQLTRTTNNPSCLTGMTPARHLNPFETHNAARCKKKNQLGT